MTTGRPGLPAEDAAQPVLICEGVHKSYAEGPSEIAVLRGVDLRVQPGERVAITGKSGAGKSTLLHVLGSLELADRGEVRIGGQSLASLSERQRDRLRNEHIGFVYQFHHLLPEFSARENVAMPLLIRGDRRIDAYARADEMLDQVGLADRGTHRPGELSGGERQRTALGRALVARPALVLADEPTGNLDDDTAGGVQALMLQLAQAVGTAFVVVTHDIGLANAADRALVLHDGVLRER